MNKEILRLAVPNIISNISVPLISTVDIYLMGGLSGLHIGAVGVGAMIFNFIFWNFGFLRMGTTGVTAQAYGRGDEAEMINTLGRGIVLVILIGTLIILFQQPLGELAFYLMKVSPEQRDLVETYFYIRIWTAPSTLVAYAFFGWFFGMQNAIYPLIILVVVNVTNVFLSFLLVQHFQMDVRGVAWGSVISEYTGIVVGTILFFYKYSSYFLKLRLKAILEFKAMKSFMVINRDIFLRTICLTIVFAFFYAESSAEGAMILAANTILMQFINWMSYGIDGFAYASESLVGKYKGANDLKRLKQAINYSFFWGLVLAAMFSLIYFLGGEFLLSKFTKEPDVIAAAQPYLLWVALIPIAGFACYIWDGIFIGLTASSAMRDSMVLSFLLFFGTFYFFESAWGNHGLWLALLVFLVGRGIIQYLFFRFKNMLQLGT